MREVFTNPSLKSIYSVWKRALGREPCSLVRYLRAVFISSYLNRAEVFIPDYCVCRFLLWPSIKYLTYVLLYVSILHNPLLYVLQF